MSKFIRPSLKAPRFSSRRFPQTKFANVAYETDAPPAPKPDTRSQEDLLKAIQEQVNRSLVGTATKEELQAIIDQQRDSIGSLPIAELREMADKDRGVMAIVARQGLELQRLQAAAEKGNARPLDMSVRAQVQRWTELPDNAKLVTEVRAGNRINRLPSPMEIRLDSPMHVSTVNAGASPYIGRVQVESGINDFLRIEPNFWNYIKKGRTNSPTYVWVNKSNPLGAAAFIGPGVAKPGVSFSLVAEQSVAKKIADSAKCGTELLQDIDGMTSFIEDELRYQINIKVNQQLMVGVSSSTNPAGIQTLSVAYPPAAGIFTTDPNYMDAIRAGIGYMRSGLLQGPITVFVNPIDLTNMDMTKANTSGVYLLPPFATASGRVIAGATIVEDYNIPVGFVQFAFLNYYRILIYKDLYTEWGWENDDFTKNLMTAIGEMRLHQFFNSIYTGAFMYDSFANIITAITAP